MRSKNMAIVGGVILSFYVVVALLAPIIAPFDVSVAGTEPYLPPSSNHLLGTNDIGQDIFSELLMGTRLSLLVGFTAAAISIIIACIFGVLAGWLGGVFEHILSAICAFFITIPFFPLLIVLSALIQGGPLTTAIILGLLGWPETARILRAQTIHLKEHQYIQDIKAMGAKNIYILTKHILRELFPMIIYRFILRFRSAILAEAALSFLGFGSPVAKSWGNMLFYAQAKNAFLTDAWLWWLLPPGIALVILVFALVMISYYFEELSNPLISKSEEQRHEHT